MHLAGADRMRRSDRADDPCRERRDDGPIRHVTQEYSKLVAADARDPIAFTQSPTKSLRHGLEQFVAQRMAERLIDVLEVVEIEVEDGETFAAFFRRRESYLQPFHKGH